MSNTEQTMEAIKRWTNENNRKDRYEKIKSLAFEAGIGTQFTHIPDIHIMNLDYDRYWMNVLALSKIIAIKGVSK